jgi:hypothetical protein
VKGALGVSGLIALMAAALPAAAGDDFSAQATAAAAERQAHWGVNASLGTGSLSGDFKPPLRKPVTGDLQLFRITGPWRFGVGVSFGSFKMDAPYDDELEWGFQQTYLSATRVFRRGATLSPYLQARAGLARLHPRSELFTMDPLPEDFESGDSPTKPANGFSVGLVPGLEWNLTRTLALDVSGSLNYFSVDEYDLAPVNAGLASSGTTFEARIGLRWHPDDGYPPGPAQPGSPDKERDAWGVAAGRRPRPWASTGSPPRTTSTGETPTSTRSARAAGGKTSSTASPSTTTSSAPTSTSTRSTGRPTSTPRAATA